MKRLCMGIMAAATLSGCSTAILVTHYEPAGLRGGYTDKRMSEDRYRIQFRGNGFVPADLVTAFATMRGAELCEAAGYPYLTVLSKNMLTTHLYVNGAHVGDAPTASVEVACSYDPERRSLTAADFIKTTRETYPESMKPDPAK